MSHQPDDGRAAAPGPRRGRLARLDRAFAVVVACHAGDGLSMFLLPPYLASIDLPVEVIGLIVAAGGLASLVSRLPAGLLYRPARAHWLLTGMLALGLLATALLAATRDPLLLGALRALGGLAFGVATTINLAQFIDAIPAGRDRANAMSYYSAAVAGGYMVGGGLGGFVGEVLGYGVGFVLAAAAFGLGSVAAATLPARRVAPPRRGQRAGAPWWATLRALLDPGLFRVALAAFLMAFIQMLNVAFFPLYALAAGFSLAEIGIVRVASASTNVVARGLGGAITHRLGRGPVQHVGLLIQGSGLTLLPLLAGFWPVLVLMLVVALSRAAVLVANTIALAEDVDEARVPRGAAAAVFSAATDLGNVVAPALGGGVAAALGLNGMLLALPPIGVALYLGAMLLTRPRARASTAPPRGSPA